MAFCPQCGAKTEAGMSFCTSCGRTLAAPEPAPAVGATAMQAPPAPAVSGRPLGKMVALWKTIVYPFITLGIYVYVFWWRVSGEIDAYAGSRSRGLARAGVLVTVLGMAIAIVAAVGIIFPLFAEAFEMAGDDPDAVDAALPTEEEVNALYLASPLFLSGAALIGVGSVVLWTGLWRAWTALAADEAQRAAAPIKPPVLLGILVAGPLFQALSYFVPGIGILSFIAGIAAFYVMFTTQDHLNRTWIANGAPPLGA